MIFSNLSDLLNAYCLSKIDFETNNEISQQDMLSTN